MATTKKKRCPGCSTEVEAEALNCPACPHSWASEDEQAMVPKKRHGRGGYGPVLWMAGLVGVGLLLWQGINFVIKYADSDGGKDNPIAAVAEAHKNEVPAAQRIGVTRAGGELPPGEEVVVTPAQPAQPGEPAGGEGLVIGESPRTEPMAKEWRLRGTIYDILTLKPVKRATVTFKDNETNESFETVTDSKGKYRMMIPSLPSGGYYVSIAHPDYAQSYADPSMPGISRKSWDDRKEMAQQLIRSLDPPSTVQGWGKKPVITDFYLAPSKGDY